MRAVILTIVFSIASALPLFLRAHEVSDSSKNAFSNAIRGLTGIENRKFFKGRSLFRDIWSQAPSSTKTRDGLGPIFNAKSCVACHAKDGRGRPPIQADEKLLSMLFGAGYPVDNSDQWSGDPIYGKQIQPYGIPGVKGEGEIKISYQEIPFTFPDGEKTTLLAPSYDGSRLNYGPLHPKTQISPRVAPQLPGLGLLEAIHQKDLLAHADPDDSNQDGISGKAQWVLNLEKKERVVGRFGWKAGQPTVKLQTAKAFNGDIGITSSFFPKDHCTKKQKNCLSAPNGGSPELNESILENIAFYTKTLAVPKARHQEEKLFKQGLMQFRKVNCTACHMEQFETREDFPVKALAGVKISPYTDLLLHDMGEGLADNLPEGEANGQEWRTPPLWGLGHIKNVNGHTRLLHDGRARNVLEAILWHGGEATKSKNLFVKLPKEERQALIFFLESL